MSIKGRVTKKNLILFLNEKFESLKIKNYKVTEIEQTRFSSHMIEGGAAKLLIKVEHIEDSKAFVYFTSTYGIRELEKYIAKGYRIIIKDRSNFGIISNFELDVTNF